MAARTRVFGAVLLLALGAGCKQENTVVVHIFRDPGAPYAAQLARAVERFQSLKMHASDGKLIVVETEPGGYPDRLQELGSGLTPELVLLNSRADAERNPKLQSELARAMELGGEGRHVVAFIPSWVEGEELPATRTFMSYLVSSGELW